MITRFQLMSVIQKAFIFFFTIFAFAEVGWGAEKVSVRVGLHDDYGRVVLEWPKAVEFSAKINGDEVQIDFKEAFEANLAVVQRRLSKYISAARIEDGKRVVLKLRRPVKLRSRTEGRLAIVDLVDKIKSSEALVREQVLIRGGQHPGRSRLVFDWKKPVRYKISQSNGKITIRFARSGSFDTRRLKIQNLSSISSVAAGKDGQQVTVGVPQNVTVNDFVAGAKVVLDIAEGKKQTATNKTSNKGGKTTVAAKIETNNKTAAAKKDVAKTKPEVKKPVDIKSTKQSAKATGDGASKREVEKKSGETVKSAAKTNEKTKTELPKGTIQIGGSGDLSKLTDAINQSRLNVKDPSQPAVSETNTGIKKDQVNRPKIAAADNASNAKASDKTDITKNDGDKQTSHEAITKTATASSNSLSPNSLSPELLKFAPNSDPARLDVYGDEDEKGSRIIFPWQRPVAAAAFSRFNQVWVVFAEPAKANLARVRKDAPSVSFSQQLRNRNATILRFRARPGLFPRFRREQAFWILEFTSEEAKLARYLTPVIQLNSDQKPQLYVPSLDNANRVILRDPEIGDELQVVPTMVSSAGVPKSRRFVDFDLLASLQGIVVRPKSDGVILESKRERVIVSARHGLILSNPGLTVSADDRIALGVKSVVPLMDLAGWQGKPEKSFIEKRTEIQQALALSPPSRRNEMRMNLARMLIGHGFSHEAAGLLELVDADDPNIANEPMFLAIRGLAKLFGGWFPEAKIDLMSSELDKFPDIYLWRAMLLSQQGNYEDASRLFPIGANHLQEQPSRMQKKLLMHWLRTTLEVADDSNFDATVTALQPFKSDPRVTNAIAWLQGRQAQRRERYADAMTFYDQVIAAGVRPYSAYARRDRVKVRLQLKQIDYAKAMDELERLRFAWRGDDFELEVTAWLADLNFEQNEFRRGLKILQESVKNYPKSKLTKKMTRRMREVFNQLFLDKKADQLKPISALALYYDFQELTPLGRKGDEMIRLLADRLANVDLLDRSATLLEHQVRFRLKGQEKSRVGARLAVIYLLDNQPKKALQTLKDSDFGLLPPALVTERRHLQVRALAEVGNTKGALALLQNDDSDEAKQLRIDIHWNSQDWPAAAQTLDAYLGRRWQADLPLTPLEQRQVVQLAITRYLSDDAAGLVLVKDRYGSKMKDSAYFETFRIITHNIDPTKTSFRDLAPAIAGIPDFEAFMASYREKIRTGGVSALN